MWSPLLSPQDKQCQARTHGLALARAYQAGLEESRGLWLPGSCEGNVVPRVAASSLTPASFYTTWVSSNRPVVLTGALDHWAAVSAWSSGPAALLRGTGGEDLSAARVTLAVTPNGWGDAPTCVVPCDSIGAEYEPLLEEPLQPVRCACSRVQRALSGEAGSDLWFVRPEEREVSLREALAAVIDSQPGGSEGCASYLSFQNDSLRVQTPGLAGLCGGEAPFPLSGLLGEPEAVNLWVGGRGCVSSAHKDHYENLHAVVAGAPKTFVLSPPTDAPFLHERQLRAGTFARQGGAGAGGAWRVIPDQGGGLVPWLCADLFASPATCSGACPLPLAARATRLRVTLQPGELLYLPALWHHAVAHESVGVSIAVNAWFPMSFTGPLWGAYQIARALAPALQEEAATAGERGSL